MNQINPIGPLQGADGVRKIGGQPQKMQPGQANFKDTLKGFMSDVNDMQVKAGQSIEKLAAGEITDVHQVMNTVAEADVAFNMMMEIRNKVMDAYQEVMRMRL